METSEFREWKAGGGGADKAAMFCSGNPGVSKTYLWGISLTGRNFSSRTIDRLYDQTKKEGIARCMLVLRLPFSARADNTGNYREMGLDGAVG